MSEFTFFDSRGTPMESISKRVLKVWMLRQEQTPSNEEVIDAKIKIMVNDQVLSLEELAPLFRDDPRAVEISEAAQEVLKATETLRNIVSVTPQEMTNKLIPTVIHVLQGMIDANLALPAASVTFSENMGITQDVVGKLADARDTLSRHASRAQYRS